MGKETQDPTAFSRESPTAREEPLVFRYSREHRLSRAPDTVRSLLNGNMQKRGFFKVLLATRAHAFLFLAIIMLSLTIVFVTFVLPLAYKPVLGGNQLSVTALSFQGTLYLGIHKKKIAKDAYEGPVMLSLQDKEYTEKEERVLFFSSAVEEDFKFSFAFTLPTIICVFKNDTHMVKIPKTVQ